MNYATAESAALEQRLAELRGVNLQTADNLDAIEEEARAITAELEKRAAAAKAAEEQRAAAANAAGAKHIETNNKKEDKNMNFEITSPEYRNAWLHEMQGTMSALTPEQRDGYTQSGTYATHAIPTEISNKFFEKQKKLAPMLSEITLLRAAGNLDIVAEGTRNSASKHTENAAISVSTDTTIAVSLKGYEFYKIVAISDSAKSMSIDAFEEWLVEMLAGDIARAIDNYIINDSTNGIDAITWTSGTNAIINTTFGYASITSLIALLPAAYDAEARFLVNKATLWGKIASIVNSAGNPIFIPDTREGFAGKLLGYPVIVDDYVGTAKSTVYLGAFRNVVGNISEDVNVKSYPDYDYARTKYRGGAIFDSAVANQEAIVRLTTTA